MARFCIKIISNIPWKELINFFHLFKNGFRNCECDQTSLAAINHIYLNCVRHYIKIDKLYVYINGQSDPTGHKHESCSSEFSEMFVFCCRLIAASRSRLLCTELLNDWTKNEKTERKRANGILSWREKENKW